MTHYSAKRALRLSLLVAIFSGISSMASAQKRETNLFQIPDLNAILGITQTVATPLPTLPSTKEVEPVEISTISNVCQNLIKEAVTLIGTPYRPGASGIRGFDCSGFTFYLFKRLGVELNRSSRGQLNNGEKVNKNEVQPGDLIFFNGSAMTNTKSIGHVGMVIANDGRGNIEFIHSARGGVQKTNLAKSAFYQKRYVAARRITELENNHHEG
ncbi:MAG: C40 family peptidase [Bacteroidales bacterium]